MSLYKHLCDKLLSSISKRYRKVLSERFGLGKNRQPRTLESIGQELGITRERVRQIERDALKKLNKILSQTRGSLGGSIFNRFKKYLQKYGGLRKEDTFLRDIAPEKERGYIKFLLYLAKDLHYVKDNDRLYPSWSLGVEYVNKANEVLSRVEDILNSKGEAVEIDELISELGNPEDLSRNALLSYLDSSRRIGLGPHSRWGLVDWPEISPRALRDRAYLVFKKERRPLHFTEIAKLIEKYGFSRPGKSVVVQSVHNDLIRDQRFVLIGRGIYALREWGYTPGTVKDVILQVLKESNQPLAKEKIVQLVLAKRKVKPTTIFLSLQDKNYFLKTEDGKFTVQSRLV